VSYRGASGGICTLWDPSVLELRLLHSSRSWIFTEFWWLPSGNILQNFNIYVPSLFRDEQSCRSSFKFFGDSIPICNKIQFFGDSIPICNKILVGDFNIVLSLEEKHRGVFIKDSLQEIVDDIISDWDLFDPVPTKCKFAWTNRRVGPSHISERLDCFLAHSYLLLDNL
jgi:hypothetical protein